MFNFRRCRTHNLVIIIITSIGLGILAAFILPAWFLAICEAALIVLIGFCYLK